MYKLFFLLVVLWSLLGCSSEEIQEPMIDWDQVKSSAMNKDFAIEEDLDIKLFLAAHPKWKVEESGSGLRLYIYEHGTGEIAQRGMDAEVQFSISKLDGTICYATDSLETETFRIDKSNVETGVQEGIKKMHVGDCAKLIIPSHLGHGLSGDFDKIPPLTPLVVDLKLISLKKR
jgi:FKBP-type peptidyl-prolyl cis-trans isomerase